VRSSALADTLGRLALIGGKTPHNRLSRLCYCKKDLELRLKQSRLVAMILKSLTEEITLSVVQVSVRVTESLL
jgi:hypothetical protein